MIPETKDPITLRFEPGIPCPVALDMSVEPMLGAIDLDYDFRGVTDEIRHIRPHWDLTADVQSLKAMCLESMPERALGGCHLTTQPLGL
jgi:hypothetical protein